MRKDVFQVIRAVIPFSYVQHFRYYQGVRLVSYLLGDLAPVVIYVLVAAQVGVLEFFLAWSLFWAFYEIGYLENDCRSIKHESRPSHRVPPVIERVYPVLVIARLLLSVCLLSALLMVSESTPPYLTIAYIVVTGGAFFLHNRLLDYRKRIVTLTLLGILKPLFVPGVLGMDVAGLVVIIAPTVIIKLFDYATEKGYATLPLRDDRKGRLQMILAYSPIPMLVDIKLILPYGALIIHAFAIWGEEKWERNKNQNQGRRA